MKLVIDNLTWKTMPCKAEDIGKIHSFMVGKIQQMKIKHKSVYDSTQIIFEAIDPKKKRLFCSSVKNKIIMHPDDSRIKKFKRDFLETEKLTEKQFKTVYDAIVGTLDRLGLTANIKFYEFENDDTSFIYWREGMKNNVWPQPETFPIEGDKV